MRQRVGILSNINLRTGNRLKIATNVNCKINVRQRKLREIRTDCEEQNMASTMFAQNLWGRSKARIKRKAQDSIEYLRRRDGGSKAQKKFYLRRRIQFKILQPV